MRNPAPGLPTPRQPHPVGETRHPRLLGRYGDHLRRRRTHNLLRVPPFRALLLPRGPRMLESVRATVGAMPLKRQHRPHPPRHFRAHHARTDPLVPQEPPARRDFHPGLLLHRNYLLAHELHLRLFVRAADAQFVGVDSGFGGDNRGQCSIHLWRVEAVEAKGERRQLVFFFVVTDHGLDVFAAAYAEVAFEDGGGAYRRA